MFPGLVIWNGTRHAKECEKLACCVRGYHAAVGELLSVQKGTE